MRRGRASKKLSKVKLSECLLSRVVLLTWWNFNNETEIYG